MARAIDADDAILQIERREKHLVGDLFISVDAMKEFIKNRPTIEPKQEWTSVKDRLPKQYSYVIAFTGLEVMEAFYDGWRFGCTSKSHPISVTHWMPLPEPPETE